MKLLLDTQLLLWIGVGEKAQADVPVSLEATTLIADAESELYFSAASVWKVD